MPVCVRESPISPQQQQQQQCVSHGGAVKRLLAVIRGAAVSVGGPATEGGRGAAVAVDGLQAGRPLHLPRRRVGPR